MPGLRAPTRSGPSSPLRSGSWPPLGYKERCGCREVYQTARISKMRQEHAAEVLHRLKWDKELQALKDAP